MKPTLALLCILHIFMEIIMILMMVNFNPSESVIHSKDVASSLFYLITWVFIIFINPFCCMLGIIRINSDDKI